MEPKVLLDYELAVSQSGYVVRALLKLEGKAPDAAGRVTLKLSLVHDRSASMAGAALTAVVSIRSTVGADDAVLGEETAAIAAMARVFESGTVEDADEKYVAQWAYNADRGERAYSKKLQPTT